jgi:hypothetical protein
LRLSAGLTPHIRSSEVQSAIGRTRWNLLVSPPRDKGIKEPWTNGPNWDGLGGRQDHAQHPRPPSLAIVVLKESFEARHK